MQKHHPVDNPPNFWPYLLSLLVLWGLAGWLMSKTCCEAKQDTAISTLPDMPDEQGSDSMGEVSSDIESAPFRVSVSHDALVSPVYDPSESFQFKVDSYNLNQPMSDALKGNLSKLNAVLASDQYNQLVLTGRYRGDEKNTSAFPSLGLARANYVKSLLVKEGFDTQKIKIADTVDNYSSANSAGVYDDRVSIEMTRRTAADLVNTQIEMAQLKADIRKDPLVLYFNVGEAQINLTAEQRDKLLNLVRYLDQNPDERPHVIGHTDGQGSAKKNRKLGKERAEFAAKYLQGNGLQKKRIIVSSKGESKPIASNATEEGRAKNRRTVVTLY